MPSHCPLYQFLPCIRHALHDPLPLLDDSKVRHLPLHFEALDALSLVTFKVQSVEHDVQRELKGQSGVGLGKLDEGETVAAEANRLQGGKAGVRR